MDPTGAGDSFAGGLFGYLAFRAKGLDFENLKQGCVHGAVIASFTVEDFGVSALEAANKEKIKERVDQYLEMVRL